MMLKLPKKGTGIFIPEITVEMFRNASLEFVEELLREGEMVDIDIEEIKESAYQRGLGQNKWIPVKWHEITDEERDREGYPEDWAYFLDCEMPDDGERILVTTKNGFVELDECYCDGEYVLESGDDWIGDVLAWTQLPKPYKEREE